MDAALVKLAEFSGAGIWGLLLLGIIGLAKAWPAIRKASMDGEAAIRIDLMNRVKTLENDVREMQRAEIKLRSDFERRLMVAQEEKEAMRHEAANAEMIVEALFTLLESDPDRVTERLPVIKDRWAESRKRTRARRDEIAKTRLSLISELGP